MVSSLDALPPEIILRICSFINAEFVGSVLVALSRKFYDILSNPEVWRVRLCQKISGQKIFPDYMVNDDDFSWRRLCVHVENEYNIWSGGLRHLSSYQLSGGHYAAIDCVHLVPSTSLCITGSRDRGLCVWNVGNLQDPSESSSSDDAHSGGSPDPVPASPIKRNVITKQNAHKGWVWCLASRDNVVYSGSWDNSVKCWQLLPSDMVQTDVMLNQGPVLAVVAQPDYVVASTFNHKVKMFDPRMSNSLLATLNYHSKAVLDIAVNENYIYTCSEDKSIVSVDRRMLSVVKTLSLSTFALAISCAFNSLWAADKKGCLHWFDASTGQLPAVKTLSVSNKKVTDVKHNLGCVMALSADHNLTILNPYLSERRDLAVLGRFSSEPTKMDYRQGTLVCGFSDCTSSVWHI